MGTVLLLQLFCKSKMIPKLKLLLKKFLQGFPGGAVVKNPPAKAGDTCSSPGLGRSHTSRSN